MKKCYIGGAGEMRCKISPDAEDILIAADGGYDSLAAMGLMPAAVVGDLDSVSKLPEGVEIIKHPVRKDYTDMHLCYLEGKRRGAGRFFIYGGTGGRSDHTFANYSLLLYAARCGDEAYLIDNDGYSFVLPRGKAVRFPENHGEHISVFAIGADATVSIKGFEYECEDLRLTPELPVGVSNSSKDCEGIIEVCQGFALVMVSGDFEKFSQFIDKFEK